MKKITIWAIVIVLIIIITGYWIYLDQTEPGGEKQIIKIGVLIPLSGARAEGGNYDKNGLELAVSEINQDLVKKYPVELIYEDTQYDPKIGVTAMNKLKDFDQVKYVIGAHGSSVTLAVAPIAEENKIILITPASQSTDITGAGDYIFRTQINIALEAPVLADFIYKKVLAEPVHLMLLNTEYGKSFETNFIPYYKKIGGQIGLTEWYGKDDADFRTSLTKIKNQNPLYILIAGVPKQAALIMKQAKEMGLTVQFFATAPIEAGELIDIGKEAVEGIIFTSPYDETSEDSVMKVYRDQYFAKYNEHNEMYSAAFYDTLNILSACFEKVGIDVEKVKQCLYDTQDYQGASGILSFDANGDITKPFIFKTVKDGQFVKYENN